MAVEATSRSSSGRRRTPAARPRATQRPARGGSRRAAGVTSNHALAPIEFGAADRGYISRTSRRMSVGGNPPPHAIRSSDRSDARGCGAALVHFLLLFPALLCLIALASFSAPEAPHRRGDHAPASVRAGPGDRDHFVNIGPSPTVDDLGVDRVRPHRRVVEQFGGDGRRRERDEPRVLTSRRAALVAREGGPRFCFTVGLAVFILIA